MTMTHIDHYGYEADTHCVDCAKKRFAIDPDAESYKPSGSDSNYIPYEVLDNEGNPVSAGMTYNETLAEIPSKDGGCDLTCGTCLVVIRKHFETRVEP